jgi:hypothetical protein
MAKKKKAVVEALVINAEHDYGYDMEIIMPAPDMEDFFDEHPEVEQEVKQAAEHLETVSIDVAQEQVELPMGQSSNKEVLEHWKKKFSFPVARFYIKQIEDNNFAEDSIEIKSAEVKHMEADTDNVVDCAQCDLEVYEAFAIQSELYDYPFDDEPNGMYFCSDVCEKGMIGEMFSKDFAYRQCDECERYVCYQSPANGWNVQFRTHPEQDFTDICLKCYEEYILEKGVPRAMFEKNEIAGMFAPNADDAGFEKVDGFRFYHIQSQRDADEYCQRAIELIDNGHIVINDYERLGIGGGEGYVTMWAKKSAEIDERKSVISSNEAVKAADVEQYIEDYIEDFFSTKMEPPSAGDCLFCQMRSGSQEQIEYNELLSTGESVERSKAESPMGHIKEHITENYLVPSLIISAVRRFGSDGVYKQILQDVFYLKREWVAKRYKETPEDEPEIRIMFEVVKSKFKIVLATYIDWELKLDGIKIVE